MTPQDKLGQKQEVSIDEWDDMVRERYKIPRNLWKAMSTQESGGNWDAVSPTGVKGKWQVTEATAKQYGLDRNDPYQQVVAAAKYLRDQYEGLKDVPDDNARWLGAVGRYYGGPGAVGGDGSISTKSPDGVSTPDKHIERVAKLWGQFEKGGESPAAQPTDFSGKPVTPQPVKQQQEVKFQSPRPQISKRGPVMDKPAPLGFGGDPTQQMMQDVTARSKQVKAVPRQPTDFEKRSPLGQAGEILATGAMRGVEGLYKGLSYLNPMPSPYKGKGLLTPEAEQAMQQQEAAQDQAMPLAAPVARGLATAGVQAPAYMLGGAGGMGAGMLTAAGLSAAQEDWSKDPVRSAVRVGINATLPFAASRGANALIRPVTAPGVAATEAIAGAAGNVVPEGVEQMAFEGKLDPQRLAQTGLIGALSPLNVTGAGRQADANKLSRIQKATGSPATAPETPVSDAAPVSPEASPATPAPEAAPINDLARNVMSADKAWSNADAAQQTGDLATHIQWRESELEATKAALRSVSPKDGSTRMHLRRRAIQIEQDIAKAKQQMRRAPAPAKPVQTVEPKPVETEAARDIADDPTADLTGDLAPLPEQTAPITEDLVQPTGPLPEQAPADPRSGVATIYGRRAGTPLPPRVGEPAPQRITQEIPRERTMAQESVRTAIEDAKARRKPPAPPKLAGVRPEVLGKPLRPIDPTTGEGQSLMYGARPHHQKRLNARGEEIKAEQRQLVEEGILDEGNYRGDRKIKLGSDDAGKLASYLFESNTPESIGGMSTKGKLAFFHDPEVKGALGLTKDAGEKEIKDALNAELAGIMNVRDSQGRVPEGGITLRSVPVDVWKMWARRKALPAPTMAKFNRALKRLEGTLDDTTPPSAPDAAIPQRREVPMRSAQASDTGRPVARASAETPAAPRNEPVAPAPARVAEQPVTRAEQPATRASEPVAETPAPPKPARKAAPQKAASPAKTVPKVNEKTLTDAGWQKKSPADYRHPDGRRISRNERNRWEITRESGEGTQTFDTLRDAIVAATGEPAAKPAKPVKPSPMADDVLIKPQPEMPEDAKPLPPTSKPFNMPDPEPQPKRAAKPAEQAAKEPWQMTREEYRTFDPNGNYDQMIRRAAIVGHISYDDADKLSIIDGMGNKQFWAKTRTELETEKKNAINSGKRERADINKIKADKHFAPWRVRSMSRTAKGHIQHTTDYYDGLLAVHKERVQEALAEGKPVPPEVLADYPDLAPKPATEQPARVEKAKARRAAKPKAEAQWKPEQHIKIAADSPKKLRADDVYRLFEQTSESNHSALREYLAKVRPDLVSETDAVLAELRGDTPESKPEVVKPTPQEQKTVAKAAKGEKISERTGLTKTQESYLVDALKENIGKLGDTGDLSSKPLTIEVPGDGKFTVANKRQANNLAVRVTGQPIIKEKEVTVKKQSFPKPTVPKVTTPSRQGLQSALTEGGNYYRGVDEAYYPFEQHAAGSKGWDGNKSTDGRYLTDGYSMVLASETTDTKLRAKSSSRKAIKGEQIDPTWKKVLTETKQEGTIDGVIQHHEAGDEAYAVISAGDTVVVLDANILRRVTDATGADGVRIKDAESPLLITRQGKPVGMIMPMRVPDVIKSSVAELRATTQPEALPAETGSLAETQAKRADLKARSPFAKAKAETVADAEAAFKQAQAEFDEAYKPVTELDNDMTRMGQISPKDRRKYGMSNQNRLNPADVYKKYGVKNRHGLVAELEKRKAAAKPANDRMVEAYNRLEALKKQGQSDKPRIVTEAEARLRDSASGKLAGSGAQALADQAIVTGYKVYKQGMAFSDWTRSMLREFGGKVRPYLRDTWAKLTAAAKEFYRDQEGSAPASPGPPRRNRVTNAVRENAAKEPPRRSPYADLLEQIQREQAGQQQPAPKAGKTRKDEQPMTRSERFMHNVVSLSGIPRALQATGDFSAPLRQGAILFLPPTQWKRSARAMVDMFASLSPQAHNRLRERIHKSPNIDIAKESGLYLATDEVGSNVITGREEDFISKLAGKIPVAGQIIKASERTYTGFLDSLRMSTFDSYKKTIDKSGGTPEQKAAAYKSAAKWINYATGRGSLGKSFDNAAPLLSTIFFAPRYVASRVNVLNPGTYTAMPRAVAKRALGDLAQYAGMVAMTAYLAKLNGAEVSLDPEDADFLKLKFGETRYDFLAGTQQVMRLFYRTGKDMIESAEGQPAERGKTAIDVTGRFARSKLAPVPSFFMDMVSRKNYIGEPFKADKAVVERVVPLLWKDFYEAYEKEAGLGVLKTSPAIFGAGVQTYKPRTAAPKPIASPTRRRASRRRATRRESIG